jgi:C4-dicarboxylate transporter DctM subunit
MKALKLHRFTVWLLAVAVAVAALVVTTEQSAAQEKTLEELMNEVDDENDLEAPSAGDSAEGDGAPGEVKSLDALMNDLEDEGEVDLRDVDDVEAEPIAAATPDVAAGSEAPEESGLPGWFWIVLILLIVVMILLGEPLYVLIGSLTMYLLFVGGVFTEFRLLTSIIEQTRGLADQPVLLAIPFFVISGALMTEGDIARRLISFANSGFGFLPGGLAIAAVFACIFFAAISGSSPVTVIAIGSIMYPALVKRGYPDDFSSGVVTSAGSLGILIPPSIPMIVYAIVDPTGLKDPVGYSIASAGGGDSSVKDLFVAGLGPGLLIGLVFAIYALYIGKKFNVDRTEFSWSNVWRSFKEGFWALNLPLIILGGIYSGIFTPTQAAAVAVVYAVIVEFFIHRSLGVEDIPRVFTESAVLMGSLLIIMALALGFNLYLDRAKIPEQAVEMILDMNLSIITFLLIVNVLLIIVGFFMDILSAILILVPLLAPIAFGLGIHPLHLAVVFIVNLEIGYLTPPIGLNLFVASTLFKKGIGEIVKAVLPFIALMFVCLGLVTYVPTFSLGLVSLSKGGDFIVTFPDAEDIAEEKAADEAPAEAGTSDTDAPPEGVKSLEDLMNETSDEGGDEGGVKSLEDLMDEVDEEEAPAEESAEAESDSPDEASAEEDDAGTTTSP